MNNNREKYVQSNNHTSRDEIFELLNSVQKDEGKNIEELMNDSDT